MCRLSDRQLVDLLLDNNEDAIEYVFFHRCDGMFAHIINSVFQSQEKKEELISEFYMYLSEDDWRRLRQFQFRSGLDTWLTIVAIRFFKQKKSTMKTFMVETDSLLLDGAEHIPDDYDILNEMSKVELYKAIERLRNPRERLALLGELAGKRAETIAKELGCTVSAVYNLIKKAKAKVQKHMKGEGQ